MANNIDPDGPRGPIHTTPDGIEFRTSPDAEPVLLPVAEIVKNPAHALLWCIFLKLTEMGEQLDGIRCAVIDVEGEMGKMNGAIDEGYKRAEAVRDKVPQVGEILAQMMPIMAMFGLKLPEGAEIGPASAVPGPMNTVPATRG